MRRQPPVHSPLNAGTILDAARAVSGWDPDPRAGLCRFLRDRYLAGAATLLGSGTQALQLGIHVAARRVGGRPTVALPAYTCFDVATAAVGARVSLTLYDVDPATLAPDLDSLRRAFDEGARIVVIAPLYGVPVDWDAINACAAAAGAFLIEDAAQGHGAFWRGRPVGTLAALSILSFGRGKGWTGGRGGAVLVRGGAHPSGDPPAVGPGLWNETVTLVGAAAQCALGRPSLFGAASAIPGLHLGETIYHHPRGLHRMGRGTAALLAATHDAAADEGAVRRAHGAELAFALSEARHVTTIAVPHDGIAGYLRFPVRLPRGLGTIGDQPRAVRLGVARGYPGSIADLVPVRARLIPLARDRTWPGAAALARELVTLPTHSLFTPDEFSDLIQLVQRWSG